MTREPGHGYRARHGHSRYLGLLVNREGGGGSAFPPPGKRYCEGCATHKPRIGKAVKGWRCEGCRPK